MTWNTNVDDRSRNANVDDTTAQGNLHPGPGDPEIEPPAEMVRSKPAATVKKRGSKDKV